MYHTLNETFINQHPFFYGIAMKKVMVFVTVKCSECVHVKRILDELGVEYEEVDISSDIYRAKVVERTGYYSVPQVICGDCHIGDYKKIVSLYKENALAEALTG